MFVINLLATIGPESVRSVARSAGLDEGTLRRVLAGATWPDLRTVALLEKALEQPLYPRR